jgi:hypothetical protein
MDILYVVIEASILVLLFVAWRRADIIIYSNPSRIEITMQKIIRWNKRADKRRQRSYRRKKHYQKRKIYS